MRKKLYTLLSIFALIFALLTGCQDASEQGNSENSAQNQDTIIEQQTENESPPAVDEQEAGQLSNDEMQQTESEQTFDSELQQEENEQAHESVTGNMESALLDEDGSYTSKEEVALYIHQYGTLPSNFITKKEAKKLGWVSSEGNLGEVAPGKSIGGDYFGNYEGMLPEEDDRDYYECDINTDGSYRGAERIVFSNDGLIYYTPDHYETFELLYGEE